MKKNFMEGPECWRTDYEYYILVEMPLEYLSAKLPKWIKPIELRPGIGLLGIGAICFLEGNLHGKLPVVYEISLSIVVQPLLGSKMPVPRMAVYTFNITADNAAMLEYANNIDKFSYYSPNNFRVLANDSFSTYECSDDKGPIISFKPNNKNFSFEHSLFYFQIFSEIEGKFYSRFVKWEGSKSETQEPLGSCYKLYNHPFFKGLEFGDQPQSCYMEMLGRFGTVNYYRPVLIRG